MYRTVLGIVKNLGNTLIHEHLYVQPNELNKWQDYTLDDIDKAVEEVSLFNKSGGNSILEMTPIGYGRNPIALKNIANITKTNILFITGFHKEEFIPKWVENMEDEDIYNFLLSEINSGVTSHNLLPAAIKIGTSFKEVTDTEKRMIKIVGRIQNETGIPVITHCDAGTMGIEQVELLTEYGATPKKICLSHVDLSQDRKYLRKILSKNCFISFDHVGRDICNKDFQSVKLLSELIEDGYINQICLSGDMGRKKYWKSYGGTPGLDYIFSGFRNEILKVIPEEDFFKLTNENPQILLNW